MAAIDEQQMDRALYLSLNSRIVTIPFNQNSSRVTNERDSYEVNVHPKQSCSGSARSQAMQRPTFLYTDIDDPNLWPKLRHHSIG